MVLERSGVVQRLAFVLRMRYTCPMPTLSIRLSDEEAATLDRLVVAVRAYYDTASKDMPLLAQVGRETTKSSALRDLLLAWKHGKADELFNREITEPSK